MISASRLPEWGEAPFHVKNAAKTLLLWSFFDRMYRVKTRSDDPSPS